MIDTPKIVLCIPGPWQDRSDLLARIVRDSGGYLFAGQVLLHLQSGDAFELHYEPRDPRMADAFAAAGPHWLDSDDMARIHAHASVVYLIGDGGSRARAEAMMLAAAALLDAGGLGVKVESSRVAHGPGAWRQLCADLALFSAHRAYVLNLTGEQVHSCGMHQFGMKDAIVAAQAADDPVALLHTFTWYLFTEAPPMREGHTFAVAEDAPRYRLDAEPSAQFQPGDLFANPYGLWRLTPL
ncbi:hypothetical protein A6R71_10695 [Xanthomonas translucens pv. arrhenatheri]|uniref:DUF4261 domain-containing protein n=1 Tax=Xanthomonas graminis pv. arrhenatheri LMG 727 TaxID=1195923 RepID=A0A0K2ZDY3_9XANT|nr:hypothetical protein [Xanthomonas translucens]OAX64614.1 hypothetical protein A6R71_10695 [Xanthomonas translucens pv. arrhenatheri]UKE76492.1 DUF4261 domain-containing protein [Xanthomonas translucens pv. arrhenatheri]CTP82364.1 hypothetical protein XTALMG727_0200 [Xanthomonas translucens pv. arrhenatheri LMG 727]